MANEEFGVVGFRHVGEGLASEALAKGINLVGLTRHGAPAALVQVGLVEVGLIPPRMGAACYRRRGSINRTRR